MSKWIDKDLFDKFREDKIVEREQQIQQGDGVNRMNVVWRTPEKGTTEIPKVYEGRFLPDPTGKFYMKCYYHMFQSGEKWMHIVCDKTFDFDNYCPFCSVVSNLYKGTAADKKAAYNYRRKEKFVGNWFVVDDPRDAEVDEERKVVGQVRIYEFPGKVETKLKEEITDKKNGLGELIFDPGEGGYNFILKVLSTKKDPKTGNVWPDYANSQFSRRSSSLGTNKEITAIMSNTMDLTEYLEEQMKDSNEIEEILKMEMLWDFVKDEISRHKKSEDKEQRNDDPFDDEKEEPDEQESDDKVDDDEDMSDADLLKELEDL